jgi:hypothetical protein
MANKASDHINWHVTLLLILGGLFLIIVGNSFECEWHKIKIDQLMAEIGALILCVETLHWVFDMSLRKAMFKEIADTALENARIHDSGVVDCLLNSKQVSDPNHWKVSQELVIGIHYSSKFFDDFHEMLKERSASGKVTKVLVLRTNSQASEYLTKSASGHSDIESEVKKIKALAHECDPTGSKIVFSYHARVLRYTFIYTEHSIWIKFFTNSKLHASVPAFKIQAGSPLFKFFENDMRAMMEEVANG